LVNNRCRFIAGDLKAFFFIFFALFFFPLTLATILVSASFLPNVSKVKERLKVKFWSSEMVKIGRGQQNYRRCRHRYSLQNFVMMKTTV
jgi:hypothetical protein